MILTKYPDAEKETMGEVYVAIFALAAVLTLSFVVLKKKQQKKVEFKKEAPKYVAIRKANTTAIN